MPLAGLRLVPMHLRPALAAVGLSILAGILYPAFGQEQADGFDITAWRSFALTRKPFTVDEQAEQVAWLKIVVPEKFPEDAPEIDDYVVALGSMLARNVSAFSSSPKYRVPETARALCTLLARFNRAVSAAFDSRYDESPESYSVDFAPLWASEVQINRMNHQVAARNLQFVLRFQGKSWPGMTRHMLQMLARQPELVDASVRDELADSLTRLLASSRPVGTAESAH